MKIIFSKKALSIFFRNKRYCCAFFFSLISISFQAQIFQSNNSQLYVSEGSTVVEIHDESIIENIKPTKGDFYISKNAVVSDSQNILFAKVVAIENSHVSPSQTKHLAASQKRQKEKEKTTPTKKFHYSFECPTSPLLFNNGNHVGKSICTTSNTQLVGAFSSQTKIDYRKYVLEQSVKSFYENEDLHKINGSIFSIRPPPMV